MLWIAAFLPLLSLDVLVRGEAAPGPTAVFSGRGGQRRLTACNAAAVRAGVVPGMGLEAAWALLPSLVVLHRDEGLEAEAVEGLACWAGQFSALVSPIPGAGLRLEAGRSRRYFGGIEPLVREMRRGLEALGYGALLAGAPTPLGAWLLARGGAEAVVEDQPGLERRLSELPLGTLELPADRLQRLSGLGLERLGDVLALPRDGLARRLGPDLGLLLDRALGRVPDPQRPHVPPADLAARLVLPAPVGDVEALLFPLNRLILGLAGHLRGAEGGVQRLRLELRHEGRGTTPLTVGLTAPSRDPEHLLALTRARLEGVRLQGPVEEVMLRVEEVLPLPPAPLDLFAADDRRQEGWGRLLERLRARLGQEAVQGLDCRVDHRPERARTGQDGDPLPPGWPSAFRPLWLLDRPMPLEAAGAHPVLEGVLRLRRGPERIESGWWDGHDVRRDYFVAEDPAGRRFWVFRELGVSGRWFLHGVFG